MKFSNQLAKVVSNTELDYGDYIPSPHLTHNQCLSLFVVLLVGWQMANTVHMYTLCNGMEMSNWVFMDVMKVGGLQ